MPNVESIIQKHFSENRKRHRATTDIKRLVKKLQDNGESLTYDEALEYFHRKGIEGLGKVVKDNNGRTKFEWHTNSLRLKAPNMSEATAAETVASEVKSEVEATPKKRRRRSAKMVIEDVYTGRPIAGILIRSGKLEIIAPNSDVAAEVLKKMSA